MNVGEGGEGGREEGEEGRREGAELIEEKGGLRRWHASGLVISNSKNWNLKMFFKMIK